MNMQHIEYILTLAKERNFSKAAEQLFLTQSALSQYVRKLEQQLGITLFHRGSSAVTLTPEGELYVQALHKIKKDMLDFHRRISDLTDLRTGKLTIGTSAFYAAYLLPDIARKFTRLYPGVALELITDHTVNLKSALTSGKIDFCVDTGPFEKNMYSYETLFEETHYLAVSPTHPLSRQLKERALTVNDIKNETTRFWETAPVSLRECQNTNMIGLKPENNFFPCQAAIIREARYKPHLITSVETIETAFCWANAGIAIAIVPGSLIRHGGQSTHPDYYKLDSPHARQPVVIAAPNGRCLSAAAAKFTELLYASKARIR